MNKEKEYIKVNKESMEIVQRDLREISEFLIGLSLMAGENEFYFRTRASKLTNAIQWLNGWGEEK